MVEEESDIESAQQADTIKLYKNSKGVNFDTKVVMQKLETEEGFRKRLKDRYDYLMAEYGERL